MGRAYIGESATYSASAAFRIPIDEFISEIARDILIPSEQYEILHEHVNLDAKSAGVVVYAVVWRHIDTMKGKALPASKYAITGDDDD